MGNLFAWRQQQQSQPLSVAVSQRLRRKRRPWKAPLADPVRGGRPAAAASADAYTLNLWAADEDRTLTERQRRGGGH